MASGRKRRAESDDDHGEETEQNHQQQQSEEQVEVPELPPEVTVDILSRLPVKSVFICRHVCKLWLSLISGSDFAKIHLSRSQVSLLAKLISHKGKPRHVQLIDLEIAPFVGSSKVTVKLTPKKNLPRDPEVAFNFVNSCNGLLCLCDPLNDPIYVCNPILGEYITLPRCDSDVKCILYSSAFGFSPTTNQYKVVRSFRRRFLDPITGEMTYDVDDELEIYTLGEGSWRSKGESSQTISNCNTFNAFLNGAIHWLVYGTEQPCLIWCFDFGTEEVRQVPEPSEVTFMDKELSRDMGIGVLGGCLSIRYYNAMKHLDVWVMKDYGVKESWSKHLVIQNLIYMSCRLVIFYEPIMILESGQILFMFNKEILYLYDPESDEYRKVYCYRRGRYFDGIAHIPSLVSLRDVARGENLKMCSA